MLVSEWCMRFVAVCYYPRGDRFAIWGSGRGGGAGGVWSMGEGCVFIVCCCMHFTTMLAVRVACREQLLHHSINDVLLLVQ